MPKSMTHGWFLTTKHREAQKKHQEGAGDDEDPHEEDLGVEALVELDDLDGLVEDGVEVEVALGVPVGQVDAEADGAAGEGVGRHERVGHRRLLLRLHGLLVADGGEVLSEEKRFIRTCNTVSPSLILSPRGKLLGLSFSEYLNVVAPFHGVAEGGVHVLNHKVLLPLISAAENASLI